MERINVNLGAYSRLYGLYMGIFWAVKFVFFPLGFKYSLCSLLFIALTVAVPFVGARMVRRFRDTVLGGRIGFLPAFLFTANIYMYATLTVAVVHFIYFRFIDNGFLLESYLGNIEMLEKAVGSQPAIDSLKASVDAIGSLSAIQMVFSLLSQNIMAGLVLALPTALFLKRS